MNKKEDFIKAIKENQGLIFKVASIYTNNSEDRNDLSQEITYQLWKSFDTFQEKSSLSTWMYRVAMNVAIQRLKIAKRKILTVPFDEQFLDFSEVDNSAKNGHSIPSSPGKNEHSKTTNKSLTHIPIP